MTKKRKKGLTRLFEIAGQKKTLLFMAGFLSAISSISLLIPYLSIYKILQEILKNASNIALVNSEILKSWAWIALIGLGIGLIILYCSIISSHIAAFNILYGLRIKVSEHIAKLPLGFLSSSSTGAIKKTMEQNIEKIEGFIAHTIPDFVGVIATIIFMFVIFFSLNIWMALSILILIATSFYIQFSIFFGKKAKGFVKEYYDTQETMSASAVEYVRGMPVVKIFSQSINSLRQFVKEIKGYKDYALKICDLYESSMIKFAVILNSIIIFLLPIGILLWYHTAETLSFATVWLFFIIMSPGVASPLHKLMFLGSSTREIDEGVSRIDAILDTKLNEEPINPKIPKNYNVQFKNVSFSYDQQIDTINSTLNDVNFIAEENNITALVGPSGSGKSTIANLIPKFYNIEHGEISIGGINIKDIKNSDLMDLVSFVFQDTFLFLDTIANNVSMNSSNTDMENIIRACRLAQCHDFITKLPDGYQTQIGEKGINLSGGERQRICLARAIYKNAPILVLDEATAFADIENEKLIQTAINNLIKNKTVIMIAHRLQTISNADKIVVVNNGRIIQQGKHNELINSEGIYKRMWNAYTTASSWKISTKQ
ncbi:MAG: ABC transporter ATP-binding protein [Bacteroidales bacterium]